ncbi:MAG: hypothetical protein HUK25_00705 [Treponema sp.]|nr:hypothetical protein [Treponema sp.]
MFKPNERKDRLNYCKLLNCPEGYSLDYALGTTYSLDLETLAAVCFSLGIDSEYSESMMNNPVILLNAFQKISDKILIFHEPGQIHLPKKISQLDFLLEKMVVPVLLKKDRFQNRYPAFHPKIWVLRYVNVCGEYLYRLLILSRNLTFDRSWDFCFAIDGNPDQENKGNGETVSDFLDFLIKYIPEDLNESKQIKEKIKNISDELRTVFFDTDNNNFSDFVFMPLGIGDKTYPLKEERLLNRNKNFDELVVVSPFLSNEIMEILNQQGRNSDRHKRTLFTRDFSLKKIGNKNLSHMDVYTVKDTIYEGEELISEDSDNESIKQNQDIHAKIYQLDYKKEHYLYFGSANATRNGFYKNVEVLCRLSSDKYTCQKFKNELIGDKETGAFQKVDISTIVSETDVSEKVLLDTLEQGIKEICHAKSKGTIIASDGNKYKLSINIKIPSGFNAANYELALFNSNRKITLKEQMVFSDLGLMDLSEFYVLSAKAKDKHGEEVCVERIIKIPTSPIPEERDKNVIKSIINSKETFFEYISFVLSDDNVLTAFENKNKKLLGLEHSETEEIPAVYEKLLKVCLIDKDRIHDLQFVMDNIDDKGIVPDEFRKLYELFIGAMGGQK